MLLVIWSTMGNIGQKHAVSVMLTLPVPKLLHETNWKHALPQLSHFNFRENQLLGRTGTTDTWGFIVAELKIFSAWVSSRETSAVRKVWFFLFYKLFAKSRMGRSHLKEHIYQGKKPAIYLWFWTNSRSLICIYRSVTPLLCCSNAIT